MSLSKLTAKKLTKEQVAEIVDRYVRDLSDLEGLEQMVLFGSAATGEMTEASDIDLILIFDTRPHAEAGRKLVWGKRSEPIWPADMLCVDREWYAERSKLGGVLMVAAQEGKVIFQRGAT